MSNNEQKREYIFSTTDPFGRKISLKRKTWDFHVTGGDNNRTELQGEEELVKSIVENPYYILNNNPYDNNSTRQKYMDIVEMKAFDNLKNVVVVVDHKENYGDVVTIIAKSRLNQESTKGGAIYVRGKSSGK